MAKKPIIADAPHPDFFGWTPNPAGVARVVASLPHPTFAAAAPDLMAADDNADVFLYKAWKDVLGGKYPSYPAQAIGDCTSFGSGHALDLTQCIDIALGHKSETYKETCTEAVYGFGREHANMLRSRGDGCYGAAVAWGVVNWGVVPREAVGPYSGSRAKQWGGGSGVPAEVRKVAAQQKLGTTSQVTTTDEAWAAIGAGYCGIVCSDQGFTMTRDADGHCSARGSWAHCMGFAARRTRNGKRQFLIIQSWGDNTPSGPMVDDQPSFSFWIDEPVFGRMLAGGDSFTFSNFEGYPSKPLPSNWTYNAAA